MAGHPRLLGRVVLGLAIAAGAVLIPASPVRTLVRIHDPASLPGQVNTCDRDYHEDSSARRWHWADMVAATIPGFPPVVIDPGPLARLLTTCVAGACTRQAQDGPCATVIWVRVDWDAYVDYELEGGP
jgi:hypothetical protein